MLHHRTSEHLTAEDAHLTSASMSSVSSHSLANSSSFFKMNCSSCTVPAKVTRESKRAVTPPRIPAKKFERQRNSRGGRGGKKRRRKITLSYEFIHLIVLQKKKLRYFFCLRFFFVSPLSNVCPSFLLRPRRKGSFLGKHCSCYILCFLFVALRSQHRSSLTVG